MSEQGDQLDAMIQPPPESPYQQRQLLMAASAEAPPPDGGGQPVVTPPPVASFTYSPPAPKTTDLVTFDASASQPGSVDAPITGYAWAFNAGAVTRSGPVVTWRLPSGHGSYDAVLTVTASDSQQSTQTQVLVI